MKKKLFFFFSIFLVFTIIFIYYKSSTYNKSQDTVKFRVDSEQDVQVKNNQAMISKSLENAVNNKTETSHSKISEDYSKSSDTFIMSNQEIGKQKDR